jgi:hypothetical protein
MGVVRRRFILRPGRGAIALRSRVVACLAIVLFLFGAVAPAASTPIGTPLPGTSIIQNSYSVAGCAKESTSQKWSFSLKTGVGRFAASTSGSTCPGILAELGVSSISSAGGGFISVIPVKIAGGRHNVSLGYTAAWSQSGAISSGACPSHPFHYVDPTNGSYDYNGSSGYCLAEAVTYLSFYAQVFDITNRSYFAQSGGQAVYGSYFGVYNYSFAENYTDVYWICYGPGYTGSPYCSNYNFTYTTPLVSWLTSGSAQDNVWVNATGFVASHHYALVLRGASAVTIYVVGAPHATARADLNFGTLGNGITISSVTVT